MSYSPSPWGEEDPDGEELAEWDHTVLPCPAEFSDDQVKSSVDSDQFARILETLFKLKQSIEDNFPEEDGSWDCEENFDENPAKTELVGLTESLERQISDLSQTQGVTRSYCTEERHLADRVGGEVMEIKDLVRQISEAGDSGMEYNLLHRLNVELEQKIHDLERDTTQQKLENEAVVMNLHSELAEARTQADGFWQAIQDLESKHRSGVGNGDVNVSDLKEDLQKMILKEGEYKETIEALEYELAEVRAATEQPQAAGTYRKSKTTREDFGRDRSSSYVKQQHRSRAKSYDQLAVSDMASTPSVSCLSLGDIDADSSEGQHHLRDSFKNSSTTLDTGFSDTSSRDTTASRLAETEQQRDRLARMLTKEMRKCREEVIMANKTLSDVNRRLSHLLDISTQSPLRDTEGPALPLHIRGFCVKMEKVVPDGRISEFSQYLGVGEATLQRLRKDLDFYGDFPRLFWAVIHEWNAGSLDETRATLLTQLLQACDHCQIHNPLEVPAMSTNDREIIEQSYSYLARHLLVNLVLVYLRDAGLLSASIVKYVLEPQAAQDQVIRLMDILPVFGHRALDTLIRALRRSDQGHVADFIISSHPDRFRDLADIPEPTLPTALSRSEDSPVTCPPVQEQLQLYPRQTIGSRRKFSFFNKLKFFKSGKYQFNK